MKNKLIRPSLLFFFMVSVVTASAQKLVNSFYAEFSPYSASYLHLENDNNTIEYHFKPAFGGSIGYECTGDGLSFLAELSFHKGKFDYAEFTKSKLSESDMAKWASQFRSEGKDYLKASGTLYFGYIFNKKRRLQFPVYGGFGGSYLEGGDVKGGTLDFAVKASVRFYISNHIALYAGATGRANLAGTQTLELEHEEYGAKLNEDTRYKNNHAIVTANAGIVYSF